MLRVYFLGHTAAFCRPAKSSHFRITDFQKTVVKAVNRHRKQYPGAPTTALRTTSQRSNRSIDASTEGVTRTAIYSQLLGRSSSRRQRATVAAAASAAAAATAAAHPSLPQSDTGSGWRLAVREGKRTPAARVSAALRRMRARCDSAVSCVVRRRNRCLRRSSLGAPIQGTPID